VFVVPSSSSSEVRCWLSAVHAFRRGRCRPPSPQPPATRERPIVRASLSGIPHGQQTATRRRRHPRSARQRRRPRNRLHLAEVASAARSGGSVRSPPRDAWCGTSLGRLWRSCLQSAATPGTYANRGGASGSGTTRVLDKSLAESPATITGQRSPRRMCRSDLRCPSLPTNRKHYGSRSSSTQDAASSSSREIDRSCPVVSSGPHDNIASGKVQTFRIPAGAPGATPSSELTLLGSGTPPRRRRP